MRAFHFYWHLVLLGMVLVRPFSWAFVIPSIELPPTTTVVVDQTLSTTDGKGDAGATSSSAAAWRVAMNLGRELSTPLWDSYGTSGVRFPVVVPCDFVKNGQVHPRTETISYVANVGGAETKLVQGGTWKMVNNKNNENDNTQEQRLEFTLTFPQELAKKDVIIPAGSTLVLEGPIMTQQALKQLQEAFSEARQEEWKALEELETITSIRNAPKRWNEVKRQWETPTMDEPVSSLVQKHWKAFVKGQERRKRFREKPRSGIELSKQPGRFPTMDDFVYFGTRGIIRNRDKGGMVVGTWSAEPIVGTTSIRSSYR
jgi:hypothetical protein